MHSVGKVVLDHNPYCSVLRVVIEALLAYKLGEFQEAYNLVLKSEELYPEHAETKELLRLLRHHLIS